MPTNIQATYRESEVIELKTVLTAHHQGHFEFKACSQPEPTQACFDANPLTFERDLLYDAPIDLNYPGRVYVAPPNVEGKVSGGNPPGMIFRHEFKLPDGLHGDKVLLQWHYITGNSCEDTGYENNPWRSDRSVCSQPLSLTTPEQFWNCAEIRVTPAGGPLPPTPTSPTPPSPTPPSPTPPSPTPLSPTPPSPTPPSPTLPVKRANMCGVSWPDASNKCGTPCPTGNSTVCPAGEHCYANINIENCGGGGQQPGRSPGNDPSRDYGISISARCGKDELHARETCGRACTNNGKCDSGALCWSVHANYCDDANWVSPYQNMFAQQNTQHNFRCGGTGTYGEVHARSHCGRPCRNSVECASGETCYAVSSNYCPLGDGSIRGST
mmetsp:Transcript_51720/g.155230  ORF Transcript_51720/g.155230 Transcript_51720/m.155230 type:complete len:383 (-) Transcript_51720:162-1310(-)